MAIGDIFHKGKARMAIEFDRLLSEISRSVANAGRIVEMAGLENYISTGYSVDFRDGGTKQEGEWIGNSEISSVKPSTLPMEVAGRSLDIPVTALMNNAPMNLDEVEMTVRFRFEEENGKLMAICAAADDSDGTLNEMKLKFKNSSAPEGIARISEGYVREI